MQVAIVHYHLNRGGVAQVVLNHLLALATLPPGARPDRAVLFDSGQRDGWPDSIWGDQAAASEAPIAVELRAVPELAYDAPGAACDADRLAAGLRSAFEEEGCDPGSTIVHTHNHALGKNASLPGALRALAGDGYRQLLQVHDFAEDFRPANYRHLMRAMRADGPDALAALLYPAGPGVHYAALNGRDRDLLAKAGVSPDRLHALPNPVAPFRGLPPHDEARGRVLSKLGLSADVRLVVYPVRGIRRKNVGEMLLHAALAGNASCYALTLSPKNPVEAASFLRWLELADELELNCRFDLAATLGIDFFDVLAAADALITTSVAEGFGMVFLEAWLAGQVLVGRDLPEITADFRAAGVDLDLLGESLLVPPDWLDCKRIAGEVAELHRWASRDYGVDAGEDEEAAAELLAGGGGVDFATLPTGHQQTVIRRAAEDRYAARDAFCQLNPRLAEQLDARSGDYRSLIDANAERVREAYSLEAIGRRLADTYAAVHASEPGAATGSLPSGRAILDYFLRIDRLHPVRLEA